MNAEYKVVQGFEPKPEGGDAPYWMVLDADGKVNFVADTEEEAFQHLSLLKAGLVYTPAHSLAPVAEPVIEDLLAVKNAEIARLEAENARMKALINECEQAIRAGFSAIAELSHAPYLDVSEQTALMNRVHDNLYDFNQALQAPAAPQEAVTLTVDELPNHDADDFTQTDLEFFARQARPEKFWYYEELSPRQKAAIEARRKELGL